MLESGAEVFWTSSFATDDYAFTEGSRSGEIVGGECDTLEVTVQWSESGLQTESGAIAFDPRGAGFSPGVGGEVDFSGVAPQLPLADPAPCGVDPQALSSTTSRSGLQTSHRETQRAPNPEVVEEGHYAIGAW
jgi:hypothetical protein